LNLALLRLPVSQSLPEPHKDGLLSTWRRN
jgi:hypothetical protein